MEQLTIGHGSQLFYRFSRTCFSHRGVLPCDLSWWRLHDEGHAGCTSHPALSSIRWKDHIATLAPSGRRSFLSVLCVLTGRLVLSRRAELEVLGHAMR